MTVIALQPRSVLRHIRIVPEQELSSRQNVRPDVVRRRIFYSAQGCWTPRSERLIRAPKWIAPRAAERRHQVHVRDIPEPIEERTIRGKKRWE